MTEENIFKITISVCVKPVWNDTSLHCQKCTLHCSDLVCAIVGSVSVTNTVKSECNLHISKNFSLFRGIGVNFEETFFSPGPGSITYSKCSARCSQMSIFITVLSNWSAWSSPDLNPTSHGYCLQAWSTFNSRNEARNSKFQQLSSAHEHTLAVQVQNFQVWLKIILNYWSAQIENVFTVPRLIYSVISNTMICDILQ
jgi:hypothetical protein